MAEGPPLDAVEGEPVWPLKQREINVHPLLRDAGLTAGALVVIVAISPLIVSLLGRKLGSAALGEYLLVRRVMTWMNSSAMLGLGIALPRYVARVGESSTGKRANYFIAALLCGGAMAGVIALILNSAPAFFARWLFGGSERADLILPLTLLLLATLPQMMVYGYYRGCLAMGKANILQLCNLAVVPLAAVLLLSRFHSVVMIISAIGIAMLACTALFASSIMSQLSSRQIRARARRDSGVVALGSELLRFGVRRVPGDFALNAILVAGPIVATHFAPMSQVTYLLLGMSILSMAELAVAPFSVILLSKVSQLLVRERTQQVRQGFRYLFVAMVELSVFACLQLETCTDVVVRTWLGPAFVGGVWIIRIVLLSIPFDLAWVASRSFIDAASEKALNGRNYVSSLILFLFFAAAVAKFAPPSFFVGGMAAALMLTYGTLACLTLRTAHKLFDVDGLYRECLWPLILAVALCGLSVMVRWLRGSEMGMKEVLLLEIVVFALYCAGLTKLDSSWLTFVRSSLIRLPASGNV